MFRIGEFSQIARVSGRLLRYYDSIGLLRPQRTDPETGYRYYSAGQLERLNRILALKELGLSLDQVARMLDDKISAAEIRGMLALKKAELERSLAEEAARLRHIESRLTQIEQQGSLGDYDVVVQSADDKDFTKNIKTIFSNDHDNSSGLGVGDAKEYWETNEGKLIDAKGAKAQYLRFYTKGSTADDQNHYTEIEVFGAVEK